jgi:lysyl-tRNA synthetase class 2
MSDTTDNNSQETNPQNTAQPESNTHDNEIVALRRQRLLDLQQQGRDPFAQTRFDRTHLAQEIVNNFETMDGEEVRIAGRLKTKRGQGKIAFADLWDDPAKFQIWRSSTPGATNGAVLALDLGDIVGATERYQTKRGEVPSRSRPKSLLATSLQPLR